MELIDKSDGSRPMKPKDYIVHWDRKEPAQSVVWGFFLENLKKHKVNYWIPFSFKGKYYLMTFNHCYEVVLCKQTSVIKP